MLPRRDVAAAPGRVLLGYAPAVRAPVLRWPARCPGDGCSAGARNFGRVWLVVGRALLAPPIRPGAELRAPTPLALSQTYVLPLHPPIRYVTVVGHPTTNAGFLSAAGIQVRFRGAKRPDPG